MKYYLLLTLLFLATSAASAQLDELTQLVRKQQQQSQQLLEEAESRFLAAHDQQARLLREARTQLETLELKNQALRQQEQEQQQLLASLKQTRQEQAGELLLAADVIRQHASLLADKVESSALANLHPASSLHDLSQLLSGQNLPSGEALDTLWITYLDAINNSGKIVRQAGVFVNKAGNKTNSNLIHIGPFGTFGDSGYLQWQTAERMLYAPPRQPAKKVLEQAKRFANGQGEILPIAVDPGQKALSLLGKTPSPIERVAQGGWIGYTILLLGLTGFVVALLRLLVLSWTGARIRWQLKKLHDPKPNNPLGRVILSGARNPNFDDGLIKTRLEDAVLSEVSRLDRSRGLIKLLAAVTPMLGLLGTVTGMIATFQAISHFGTGDPRLMATGISEALMTTLLGLGMAIPLLFLHSLLTARAKGLVQILHQQSAGLLVRYLETKAA